MSTRSSSLRLTPLLALVTAAGIGAAPAGGSDPVGILGARAVDLDGGVRRLGMDEVTSPSRPVALVFLDTACPVSNRYAPDLNELASVAADSDVAFFGVLSDPTLSPEDARAHRDDYGLEFPVLFDSAGDLAKRLAPTHVPEAFVVDLEDRVMYRGRIDDRFVAVGTLRKEITSRDLADAIAAVAKGDSREPARTEPVGCLFEAWDAPRPDESITYHRDVAPILSANCVECHREGDVAPFPLETYEQAKRRARMMASVTRSRYMPPWFAEPDSGHFRDERRLGDRQIAVLEAWARAGTPEGDPEAALPAPEVSSSRWRLGEPDLLVEMPVEYEVPANGDDIYRYFVVPSELTEDQAIVAIDFRPGDPSVVHHCIAYMDRTGVARRIDEKSEAPGFSVFGEQYDADGERFEPNGLDTAQQIAGWAPGTQPYIMPEGVGSLLEAGGDFVLEIHYHLTGKATTDRSALALYFADDPDESIGRWAQGLVIGTQNVDIPAGEPEYWRHAWMEVPADMDVIDVSPHMHYLGKQVDVVATLPNGDEEPLIRIDDWDFRWQGAYFYRRPLHLPQGTRIDAYFRYDNSAENPFNPSSPPIQVGEGWRTTDEMCLFYFTVVPDDPSRTDDIYRAMFASFMRSGAPE